MCAALRLEKFLSLLLPRCDLGLLLRDNLFIAILAELGSRACGDFGTYADVSNFEEILIGSHSPHSVRQFRSLRGSRKRRITVGPGTGFGRA